MIRFVLFALIIIEINKIATRRWSHNGYYIFAIFSRVVALCLNANAVVKYGIWIYYQMKSIGLNWVFINITDKLCYCIN